MVHFRLPKRSWFKFGVSSIALHLAVLSTLPVNHSQKLIEVAYLPAVQIDQPSIHKVSHLTLSPPAAVSSGSTVSVDSTSTPQKSLMYLRDSLSRELSAGLKLRTQRLEVLLSLKFSSEGSLETSEILKGSGQPAVDSEIISILKTARVYSSPELANLKVQVPVRIR